MTCAEIGEERLREHLLVLERLPSVQRGLQNVGSSREVAGRAVDMACAMFDIDRAVLLELEESNRLTTDGLPAGDAASDRLRRTVLSSPIDLTSGCVTDTEPGSHAAMAIGEQLDLCHFGCFTVHCGSSAWGVFVVDRAGSPLTLLDRAELTAFSAAVSFALEHVVIRTRLRRLRADLRSLSGSGMTLIDEAFADAGSSFERRPIGTLTHDTANGGVPGSPIESLASREREVMALLVDGLSNRDIGEKLMLSPETVKDYVARIMRKLHASNRVEAVSRYLQLLYAVEV